MSITGRGKGAKEKLFNKFSGKVGGELHCMTFRRTNASEMKMLRKETREKGKFQSVFLWNTPKLGNLKNRRIGIGGVRALRLYQAELLCCL